MYNIIYSERSVLETTPPLPHTAGNLNQQDQSTLVMFSVVFTMEMLHVTTYYLLKYVN